MTARRRLRPVFGVLGVVGFIIVTWLLLKILAGDPWRLDAADPTAITWDPPLRWKPVNDINLPHLWSVAAAFFGQMRPASRSGRRCSKRRSSRFASRSSASRSAPASGCCWPSSSSTCASSSAAWCRCWWPARRCRSSPSPRSSWSGSRRAGLGVAIVATYLTFFPVTIAALRGMRSADPRAFELMRSYAADRRTVFERLRLPASPPYLFTAFKIAATASVVGSIVGEFPAGIRDGLGGRL